MDIPPPQTPTANPQAPVAKPSTSGLAIASLICGLLGLCASIITGIPAIIMGHIGMSKIKKSNGTIGGYGLALTGTILGYVSLLLIPILAGLLTPVVLKAKKSADHALIIAEMQMIGIELDEFAASDNRYPNAEEFLIVTELPQLPIGMNGSWVYFPDTSPEANSPLLISPSTGGKCAVLYTNISIVSMTDDEVVQILQTSEAEPIEFQPTYKNSK